jgi:NAD(P)-dependent dehydrogenase (short-subunit alcohol dehydrogenase family)
MSSARTVFVVNGGVDVGSALAQGLAARGSRVVLLHDGECQANPSGSHERIASSLASRAALAAAFDDAVTRFGVPDQVVASILAPAALRPCAIHELANEAWQLACRDAMKALLYVLQAAYRHMGERGGSVVAIGPALSLAGASQLVALSSAVEGQRGLVKSTARQWGRCGLTVNWVAAAPQSLTPLFEGLPLPLKPDPVMVAMGQRPALGDGIAGVIDFLGSAAGKAMTGATLMVDGGEWMVP